MTLFNSSSRGAAVGRSGPRLLLSRALRASIPAQLVACMAAGQAAAAAAAGIQAPKKAPQRVKDILRHLQQHPMTVTSQAMQYDDSPSTPLPSCVAGLTPADVIGPASASSSTADAAEHQGHVIAGLLLAACGGLDAAHNLVTPLCWGSWTPYAGKPIAGSPAAADAAIVHAIIHRQEGSCIGEFGSGSSNACYWYRAAGEHPVMPQLLQAARKLAAGSPQCEALVAKHGSSWQPDRFVSMTSDAAATKDPELLAFCERVMAAELQLMLDHCYSKL